MFIAIFRDCSVSNPYKSETKMMKENDFRWQNIFTIVEGERGSELARKVKIALRDLRRK